MGGRESEKKIFDCTRSRLSSKSVQECEPERPSASPVRTTSDRTYMEPTAQVGHLQPRLNFPRAVQGTNLKASHEKEACGRMDCAAADTAGMAVTFTYLRAKNR